MSDAASQPAGSRQILAIMFADVVGYTALTERDEAAAVRVRRQHRDLIETLARQFDGELVDVTGDESLCVFPSALRAVDCALAVQGALQSHPELRLRIGIHLGDVLRQNGEVVGEGVNVAARVRPLAEPGGIVVSEPVYQMIRTRPHVHGRPLGPQSLKHVAQPVAVYALTTAGDGAPAAAPAGRPRLALAAGAALLLGFAALLWLERGPVLSWLALTVPRFFSTPIEQEIGFAETADGVRIAYATSGEGPPLVVVLGWLSHLTEGIGSPLYDRGGLIRSLSRDHLLVRYDGRGFGLSDRGVDDFSLEARVRDVEAVVDSLGLERFAVFGVSSGGPTAVRYAVRHSERVTHLVLGATSAGSDPLRREQRAIQISSAIQLFETSWEGPLARASMVELLAPQASEVERRVLMHFLEVSSTGPSVAGFLRASLSTSVARDAQTLRVPTLVVAGSEDTTILPEQSRELASLIPGARFELLDGATHVGASGGDPRLVDSLLEFVASAPPSE